MSRSKIGPGAYQMWVKGFPFCQHFWSEFHEIGNSLPAARLSASEECHFAMNLLYSGESDMENSGVVRAVMICTYSLGEIKPRCEHDGVWRLCIKFLLISCPPMLNLLPQLQWVMLIGMWHLWGTNKDFFRAQEMNTEEFQATKRGWSFFRMISFLFSVLGCGETKSTWYVCHTTGSVV